MDGSLLPPSPDYRALRRTLGGATVNQLAKQCWREGRRKARAQHPVRERMIPSAMLFWLVIHVVLILRAPSALGLMSPSGYLSMMIVWWAIYLVYLVWITRRQGRQQRHIELRRKVAALRTGRYPNCTQCNYDVSHGEGNTCPECGEPVLLVRTDCNSEDGRFA